MNDKFSLLKWHRIAGESVHTACQVGSVKRCPDDTAHDPNGPDDTDRGYGPVRYTPIYTPRYDN